MPVTTRYLLEGAWYAAEQCGLLLRDALPLYNGGRFGTATALGLVAREELGKAQILLRIAKEIVDGKPTSPSALRRRIAEHLPKQKAGLDTVFLRTVPGTSQDIFATTFLEAIKGGPSDPEAVRLAEQKLRSAMQAKAKRAPDDRVNSRLSALYVDPDKLGSAWNRPVLFPAEKAEAELFSANRDYFVFRDALLRGEVERAPLDPTLARELDEWTERPELPEAVWPSLPLK